MSDIFVIEFVPFIFTPNTLVKFLSDCIKRIMI